MPVIIDCFITGTGDIGSLQFPPFRDCPICGTDVHVLEDSNRQSYFVHCPTCYLIFGLPYGYSSRLDMANDWNRRYHEEKEFQYEG